MPVTWCLADPKLGEREVCLDLLTIAVETGLVVPGATVLADKGLAGRDVEQQIAGLGVRLLRPDRRNEPRRHGSLGGVRQWIESVFDTLKGQLGLEHHGAPELLTWRVRSWGVGLAFDAAADGQVGFGVAGSGLGELLAKGV